MKIKKEEIDEEDIKKEKIKKEDVESSFRASLSRFSYPPPSPPSPRPPPKRPSPDSDSNPNPPSSSASLTVTVAVAQPTPVRQDNEESVVDSGAVQVLRRSARKRKGETRPSLDTDDGDGNGDGGTRPSEKIRRGPRRGPQRNRRAPDVDLSQFGALPEHVAEDLDGTFLLTMLHSGLHKMIVCTILNASSAVLPPFLFLLSSGIPAQ
jgi:hypothetical protein